MTEEFEAFPKIVRLNRPVCITEKLDGTNAGILVSEDGQRLQAASRSRWITPDSDNYGFAKWAEDNYTSLLELGPGMHWGEWWGQGIQRRYGLKEKRFSLFNAGRWGHIEQPPACCHVVPVLYRGLFSMDEAKACIESLQRDGSVAAPGFDNPEGIVIFHEALRSYFKWTVVGDEKPKGSKE